MKKLKIDVLHLCYILSAIIALAGVSSAALLGAELNGKQQPKIEQAFDIDISWEGLLFNGKIAPSMHGETTLHISGESACAFELIIELDFEANNFSLADETQYIPLEFMLKKGELYLQPSGDYAPNKHAFNINELSHMVVASFVEGERLDCDFILCWEWNDNREISDLYVCQNDQTGLFSDGDIISGLTLKTEEYADFSLASATDVDLYLASRKVGPSLTITPKAIATAIV